MREIPNKWFLIFIGQGYENAVLSQHGSDWLLSRIQELTRILFKADIHIEEISIVFDPKLKKAAWVKERVLLINLAKEDAEILRALKDTDMPVYTEDEIAGMSQELSGLRVKYLKGDEVAGEKYLRLSEIVLKFSS